MSAGWLVYGLVTGTLLALCGFAIEGFCRQHRLPTRWVWAACTTAALTLVVRSALASIGAATMIAAPVPGSAAVARVSTIATSGPFAALTIVLDAGATVLRSGLVATARLLPARAIGIVSALWLVSSIATLATLAFVHLRVRRARRAWPAAELQGQRVRITPTLGPAVVGVVNPEIVVPRWLLQRTDEEQRLVVAHESEHLRGRDHVLLAGATLAAALVPWHPAMWWMLARLRLAIELDCDARVLRRGVPARRYGAVLIDLAGQCSGFRVGATALADEASHLERRLLAMKPTPSNHVHIRAAVLFACAGISLLAACEAKVPTAAEISAMDVASAERGALQAKMVDEHRLDATTFFVNGVQVSAREAHAITPNQIASVQMDKGTKDHATIRITTNGQPPLAEANTETSALRRLHNSLHADPTAPAGQTLRARGPEDQLMSGLIFVDGARIDAAAFRQLNPSTFKSVEIIKGEQAAKLYSDPAAASGVIRIITK
jgi:beta-lactamase regulating signal transducer with metallopeptidase domain